MTIISDSSPLIALSNAGELRLLRAVFGEVIIPQAVYDEVIIQGHAKGGTEEIATAQWITCKTVEDRIAVQNFRAAHRRLGPGESETIILAKQLSADWVIIDEWRGRRAAEQEGVKLIGTLGVVVLAKNLGVIDNVRHVLDRLTLAGFRVSSATYQAALEKAGE